MNYYVLLLKIFAVATTELLPFLLFLLLSLLLLPLLNTLTLHV